MAKIKITIEIEDAEATRDHLADLLCWWSGFKMGLKINPDFDMFIAGETGIEAARKLNGKIIAEISKQDNDGRR